MLLYNDKTSTTSQTATENHIQHVAAGAFHPPCEKGGLASFEVK